jgi:hypothetical protein
MTANIAVIEHWPRDADLEGYITFNQRTNVTREEEEEIYIHRRVWLSGMIPNAGVMKEVLSSYAMSSGT